MSDLKVITVKSRREQQQFLDLPWEINRDDPNWIPPLRMNQRELVGYKSHPFYERNLVQTFLAERDGKPCGRIAAIVNYAHIERHKDNRGFFGFFECVDDQEVANALFDAAKSWFAERDIVDMRGPMNPSMNYECGLLIDGFDTPPMFMMTHNLPYYPTLIEGYGFRKTQDMYAFWGHVDMLETLDSKLDFVVQEATRRFGIDARRLNRRKFAAEVRMFLRIYNDSLAGTWGFTPLSEKEIQHLGSSLRFLIVPEMTTVAEVKGKPVAAAFALLDYNPRIKQIDCKLFPFGFLKLLWNRRAIRFIRVISANVTPEYQKWGLGLVTLSRVLPDALAWGIEGAEFSWVLESNDLSFKSLKRGGAQIRKQYRIYDYGPNPDPDARD